MPLFNKFTKKIDNKEGDEIRSIIENLNNMLNTKKGFGFFLKGFGIDDMNQYTSKSHIGTALMEEIRYNIEHFEPRLKVNNIQVEDDDKPFSISFKIECTIKQTSKALHMEFDSIYNGFTLKD